MALSISLFGPFRARLDGDEMPIRSRRSQALLAMLALSPASAISRDRIAATLWPDRAEEQARASLRQEVSSLRRLLGSHAELLKGDATAIKIDRAAIDPDFGQPEDGDFLEGLDLRSEPFDDWRRAQMARLADAGGARRDAPEGVAQPVFFRRPAVLVAGFVPPSRDEADVALTTGLVSDLRNALAAWRWFPVMGPEAIGWQSDQDANLRELATDLGATYAISGAVRRAGARIRVSVSLTRIDTGHAVWTDTFDGDLSDVFDLQESIARGVVARVVPEVERAEAMRLARRRPSNPAAWQLLAETEQLERTGGEGYGTPASNAAQVPLLEEALRIDPEYARAWTRLGRYYFRAAMQGWIPDREEGIDKALDYTGRALTLDGTEWEGQAYHALTLIFGRHDFGPARVHAHEAVRLNPSAPTARHGLGCALEWIGEIEEALHHLRLIFELNPNHPNRAAVLGNITTCELLMGNTEAAASSARQLRDLAPDYCRGLQRVVVSLALAGHVDEAAETLRRVQEMLPNFDEAYVRQTYPYADPKNTDVILEGLRCAGWAG